MDPNMASYPARYESDIVLLDGSTLRLRPVRKEDASALKALHLRLSPQSVYFRFFAALPELDDARVRSFTSVDYRDVFAMVGEVGGRVVAVAHYFRNKTHPDRAEVAFVIEDRLQRRGIGTRMLERLAEIAREHGITTFDAEVLGENYRMMDVFLHSGFEVQRRMEGGAYHVVLSILPTEAFEERAAERAQGAASASMKAFFEPKSVAVVGAGRRRGGVGAEIFHNLVFTGFQGVVYPVNARAEVIGSVRAFPRVTAIPDSVDLAIIVVPADQVEEVVDDCIEKGVRALIVISAGFSEIGVEGRRRESVLLDKVRAAGLRMVGPNCMGIVNTDPAVA
ncbi:MAG: GNAT family N-acetyltransferase, partial [Acidobacteria bacterium]|nr:GNAT family N-acetyltransferase [Acidobacteriota bacterium]